KHSSTCTWGPRYRPTARPVRRSFRSPPTTEPHPATTWPKRRAGPAAVASTSPAEGCRLGGKRPLHHGLHRVRGADGRVSWQLHADVQDLLDGVLLLWRGHAVQQLVRLLLGTRLPLHE